MDNKPSSSPLEVVIVGAGERSELYATYQLENPDRLKIVGVVDPSELRRNLFSEKYQIPEEKCFKTLNELLNLDVKLGDAVINGTMDRLHVPTTIPLIEKGYDVLLEKPIGISEKEVVDLYGVAKKNSRKVFICHVLRYSPFYIEIKKRINAGELGLILNIQSSEHISYHHMAAAYIRGKWNNEKKSGSTILLAKSSHDLDLLTWFKSGVKHRNVSSYGSLMYFNEKNAPEGSGTRCLVDCDIEDKCPFSAKKQYIDKKMWSHYVWSNHEEIGKTLDDEKKAEILKEKSDFGKCVWRSSNDVMDHQSVAIEFDDGSTGTHNVVGGAAKGDRSIHIVGSQGEIFGKLSEGRFVIRKISIDSEEKFEEEIVDVNMLNDMHGGGDLPLVDDFISVVKGQSPSISTTTLEDSIQGHLIGFKADRIVKKLNRKSL